MKKFLIFITLAMTFSVASLAAQTAPATPTATPTATPASAASGQQQLGVPNSYKLRASDVITMNIFQESDMQNLPPFRVGADGYVILPLIGKVQVSGLTIEQARDRITDLYKKDYYVNPQVNLYIADYSKQSCYVNGQVRNPSVYIFPIEQADNMTITKVIAGCGGFTTRANRRSVIVKRKFANGQEQIYDINVREILRNSDAADFPIIDGDIIEVKDDVI